MPGARTQLGPFRRRRGPWIAPILVAAVLVAGLVSGCATARRTPSLKGLPLVDGLHVVTRHRVCDQGSNAYCAIEMVLTDSGYSSSVDLQKAERLLLKKHGWQRVNAPVGKELAADSPDDHLRITYAAANLELEAIDLGWIKRPPQITLALTHQIFGRASSLAMLLQVGTN